MSIVDGTGLVEWEGMLFEPGSDLLARTRWVFNYIRERGGKIKGNEAGRPYGVPGDQYVRSASDTASGLSTVWYQWGRMQRGETPSAADPRGGTLASDHTKGLATDTDTNDIALRREAMRLVGMVQTIDSESWHFAIRGPALVDLTGWANLGFTPFDNSVIQDIKRKAADMLFVKSTESNRVGLVGEFSGKVYEAADFSFEANKDAFENIVEVATDDILYTLVNEANARRADLGQVLIKAAGLDEIKLNLEKVTRKLGAENS